jgi:oligopeptide/dipeptide ABC transporter ATP-binding protein
MSPLLQVRDLEVTVGRAGRAVSGVDLSIEAGQVMGLVGESGCGKTLTAYSVLGLLPDGVSATGVVRFDGEDHDLSVAGSMRRLRGGSIAMVAQDPLTALNPVVRVGTQIDDVMRAHLDLTSAQRSQRVLDLLDRVGIPSPRRVARAYPFELSGGMRQRALIAMAISCRPRLLIADEPTTALDTTIQAQIMELLADLVADEDLTMLLITHDLGLVAQYCDRVSVMYAGRIVEHGAAPVVLETPRHPYSRALLDCLLSLESGAARLSTIDGVVPPVGADPAGCRFADRCRFSEASCRETDPQLRPSPDGHLAACLRIDELDRIIAQESGARR